MKTPLWEPSTERKESANMTKYINFVNERCGKNFATYDDLYDWSVTSLDDFWGTYSTPGVAFFAFDLVDEPVDIPGTLDELASEYECAYDGRSDYDDGVYAGQYDLYYDCGDAESVIIELAAAPESGDYITYLVIQAISDADLEAMDHILATFLVNE